ncbi:hypothetical protein PFY10_16495 [Chryseobacterium daecheongense]|nr:hypothetical protein PFY10_16495 [Chryseobacterium daecheongense]
MKKEKKLSLKKVQMVKINNLNKIIGGGPKNFGDGLEDTGTCADIDNTSKPKDTISGTAFN